MRGDSSASDFEFPAPNWAVLDVAILDLDAAQAALTAAEMKRLRPQVPVIILTASTKVLEEYTAGDVVVPNWDQAHLLRALAPLQRKYGTA